jgi:hypothetical protein
VLSRNVAAGPDAPFIEAELHHDRSGRYGLLLYSLSLRDGTPFPIRTPDEATEWAERAEKRLQTLLRFAGRPADEASEGASTYQMQLLVESYGPTNDSIADQARRAFAALRARAAATLGKE